MALGGGPFAGVSTDYTNTIVLWGSNKPPPPPDPQAHQMQQAAATVAQHNTDLGGWTKYYLSQGGSPEDSLGKAMKKTGKKVVKINGIKFVLVDLKAVAVPSSKDPNAITGPAGFGSQGFFHPAGPLPYRVDFTNESSATAPAATVVITQQLSSNLDLCTFQLGDIGFGSTVIMVPAGLTSYNTEVMLPATAPGAGPNGLLVEISAGLNLATGLVTWTFTSLDPTTLDIPIDPSVGFLPPDDSNRDGEGFVSYTVQPKGGAATGTVSSAKATVIFDQNAPINTQTIVNTIDSSPPTSSISPLPATRPARASQSVGPAPTAPAPASPATTSSSRTTAGRSSRWRPTRRRPRRTSRARSGTPMVSTASRPTTSAWSSRHRTPARQPSRWSYRRHLPRRR